MALSTSSLRQDFGELSRAAQGTALVSTVANRLGF